MPFGFNGDGCGFLHNAGFVNGDACEGDQGECLTNGIQQMVHQCFQQHEVFFSHGVTQDIGQLVVIDRILNLIRFDAGAALKLEGEVENEITRGIAFPAIDADDGGESEVFDVDFHKDEAKWLVGLGE